MAVVLALAFTLFATDTSYVETPARTLAVTNEDVVSSLAATGTALVTITDATIAIASETVTATGIVANYVTTPVGILTTGAMLLLGTISLLYLIDNGTGQHRLARRMRRASRGIGMSIFGHGKFHVIAERVFTAPTSTVLILRGIFTPTNTPTTIRKLFASVTRLGSQGGAAYAISIAIAVLALAVIGVLIQTTETLLA